MAHGPVQRCTSAQITKSSNVCRTDASSSDQFRLLQLLKLQPVSLTLLSRDSTAAPERQPQSLRKNAESKPDLCAECNTSLILDDSVVEPYLNISTDGEKYISHDRNSIDGLAFGGMDYVRHDSIPMLPALQSHAAENGCKSCAAIRKGLQREHQERAWWKRGADLLTLRFQYGWRSSYPLSQWRIDLNSIVVSIYHTTVGRLHGNLLRFPLFAEDGPSLSRHLWQ